MALSNLIIFIFLQISFLLVNSLNVVLKPREEFCINKTLERAEVLSFNYAATGINNDELIATLTGTNKTVLFKRSDKTSGEQKLKIEQFGRYYLCFKNTAKKARATVNFDIYTLNEIKTNLGKTNEKLTETEQGIMEIIEEYGHVEGLIKSYSSRTDKHNESAFLISDQGNYEHRRLRNNY